MAGKAREVMTANMAKDPAWAGEAQEMDSTTMSANLEEGPVLAEENLMTTFSITMGGDQAGEAQGMAYLTTMANMKQGPG